MNDIFYTSATYSHDLPLFQQLGLTPFKYDIRKESKLYVGEVKTDGGFVKIWVDSRPSQFWQFDIYNEETNKTTKFTTGSGRLEDYWPTAEAIANGMIVINSAKQHRKTK